MDFLISEYHRTMLEKKEILESSLGALIQKKSMKDMKTSKSRRNKMQKFFEARYTMQSALSPSSFS